MPLIKSNVHTHTVFCDGADTPERMVLAAISAGMDTLGFSHHSYTPFDTSYCIRDYGAYRAEVERLKGAYAQKIALLVTSDSSLFLERAAEIAGVHTIPGRIVHIDGLDRSSLDGEGMPSVYMKSFLDFYMLAGARRISCPGTPEMYPSEFPMYAAKVNGIPFKRILLD